MAVSKIWKVEHSLKAVIDYASNPEKTEKLPYSAEDYQALKDVLSYAKDEEKTEKEFYVSGVNCCADFARSQFVTIKEQYGKTDGIQAYHGYLSFPPNEVTPDLAHEIGIQFAKRAWGDRFQVVVTTHLNTKCLHNHFVVNSVSFTNGLRLTDKEKAWFYLRHIADDVCKEYGLSVIKNPERNTDSYYLTMKDKAGIPTRYNVVREAIDEAIKSSLTIQDFKKALSNMGYRYKISDNLKYWTVIPKGYNKPIRLYRLGEEYTNSRVRERIHENGNLVNMKDFQKGKSFYTSFEVPDDIRKSKGSLYNLYLYYCYKLGYLPKKKIQNTARLHYLLKEDLMKLDKITEETKLLGKYRIDTEKQLFSLREAFENELETFSVKRTELWKQIKRRTTDELTVSETKSKIAEISKGIKKLKHEIELCNSIARGSHLIAENLEQIEADEQSRNYDKERSERYE